MKQRGKGYIFVTEKQPYGTPTKQCPEHLTLKADSLKVNKSYAISLKFFFQNSSICYCLRGYLQSTVRKISRIMNYGRSPCGLFPLK